ncbi:threonine aldolase family protein [Rhodobium gokarnense]|uniref:L-threonine aldolase n=1 Tax=Rhodobium gokarnense TaxID=364296 RepID=A0ABT3H6Q8_9HYPH|nr:beta-eliminating lyase-related protein [Rhodobium gokarnense]MCW2306080.1 threonine aldolase [Rhodobium gokarnense]
MFFASDNWAGASEKVAEALAAAGAGPAPAYGNDEVTTAAAARFSEIFERDVAVYFVATGTAANALALASATPAGGIVFCHSEAHIAVDECCAPEFFSGGGKLNPIAGPAGLLTPEGFAEALAKVPDGDVHHGRVAAVSLSQATEAGTVYDTADVARIADLAHGRGMTVHMDGARFANALVATGQTPAEMTWKAGVDVMSFGATKNGCWCAEAVVFFDPTRGSDFPYLRKRAGHLFSKSRFVAAQFLAYFDDDHWLENARHANAMAARIAAGIDAAPAARLAWRPQSNEVFGIFTDEALSQLSAAGIDVHQWPSHAAPGSDGPNAGEKLVRLVTSFRTTEDEVSRFVSEVSLIAA